MRTIISVCAVIITLALLNAQAFATQGVWVDNGSWLIQGDSDNGFCTLVIEYEGADMIGVTAGNGLDSPGMAFSGRNLRPLIKDASIVEASLTFSNGDFHQIVAEAWQQDMVIASVSYDAIGDFANAHWMEVRVRGILIGTYKLDGTRSMVLELVKCTEAMVGDPA